MTSNEIKSAVVDAFYNEKKVKVTRRCFGEEETCIGFIYEIARREQPKSKEQEMCFAMIARDKWWLTDTLSSLSPWCSQISEIETI